MSKPEVSYTSPAALPSPLGRYSHVASCPASADLYFIAGQVGVAVQDEGAPTPGDFDAQLIQVFENVTIALDALGLTPRNVVQFTTYVVGRDNLPSFHRKRADIFRHLYPDERYPPNTLLLVQGLVEPEFLVEIQTVAAGPTSSTAT